jgi:hypothetical protein
VLLLARGTIPGPFHKNLSLPPFFAHLEQGFQRPDKHTLSPDIFYSSQFQVFSYGSPLRHSLNHSLLRIPREGMRDLLVSEELMDRAAGK